MTNDKLKLLVRQAVELDREISRMEADLKAIKARLITEAESRYDEAQPTEGGGTSHTFESDDGCICRITTSGANLKSSIKAEGKDIEKIKDVAGRVFAKLFETVLAYKPVPKFREEAEALLGKDSKKLIKLCETAGKTTVAFETKETVNAG